MVSRRLVAIILGTVTLALAAGPVAAKAPRATAVERPLTAEEQAASDARVAAADAYLAERDRAGQELSGLACVPTAVPTESASADGALALAPPKAGAGQVVAPELPAACWVPQGFLPVEARDQTRGHYCGPAVGQVIANYSWMIAGGGNKFLQAQIATWMNTDRNGGTDAFNLERGLEMATGGAPRRPAGWNWVVTNLVDTDGDGTTGDQLHGYVRANVSGSQMPLAIAVKPHDPTSRWHLFSWPRPVRSIGHWIAAYGWLGNWTGDDAARIYYTDSSRDEGGATGKFWTPTRHIAFLIGEHTKRFVW